MERYRLLDWDSAFLGISVAKILPDRLDPEELERIIGRLKREKINLAYWASDPADDSSQLAARQCHGFLADRKMTFVKEIGPIPEPPGCLDVIVEEYTDSRPCATMEDLSVQAGGYSRFRTDRRMPPQKHADLYTQWIRKSVNRLMADVVLVARQSDRIVGLTTIKEEGGDGRIGLFAVDVHMRRKRVGMSLVHAVDAWTRAKGLKRSMVVTQAENAASCALYRRCGYRLDKTEHFYHFWLS